MQTHVSLEALKQEKGLMKFFHVCNEFFISESEATKDTTQQEQKFFNLCFSRYTCHFLALHDHWHNSRYNIDFALLDTEFLHGMWL